MKNRILLVTLLVLGLTTVVQAEEKASVAGVSTQAAANLVRPVLYAYVDNDWLKLGDLLADDFVPNKIDFRRQATESFFKARPMSLEVVSGQIMDAGEKKVVKFRWAKDALNLTNRQMVKKEGEAEFVFVSKDKKWVLQQINGESPFGD